MAPTGRRLRDVTCAGFLLALTLPVARAGAQEFALPKPVGFVNDFAHVMSPEQERYVDSLAQRVRTITRGEMVTVTLADLGGRPVEEIARRLGREWKVGADAKIGDAARNAGVIVLLVPKETSKDGKGYCRVEVGQGAEGFITDGMAGQVCRDQIERFRKQAYGDALEEIATEVATRYAAGFNVTLDGDSLTAEQREGDGSNGTKAVLTVLLAVATVFVGVGLFFGIILYALFAGRSVPPTVAGDENASGKPGRRKSSRRSSAAAFSASAASSTSSSSASSWSGSSSSSSGSSWSGSSFGGGGGFSGGGGGSSW